MDIAPWQAARRAVVLFVVAASFSACGFQPALSPDGSLGNLQGRIQFADPADRTEFVLVAELEKRLGRGADLDLSYVLRTKDSDVGISPDQVITRQQIDGAVDIALSERATGSVILRATLTGFTSYGTTGTTASTAFAREAALDRLMVILADRIVSRLAGLSTVPR